MNMDIDEPFVKIFSIVIKREFQREYDLMFTSNRNASYIYEETADNDFGLYILNMSRFLFPDVIFDVNKDFEYIKKHIEKSLQIVTYLNKRYKKPVIVLSSWANTNLTERMAKKAGASYFFEMPCDIKTFRLSVRKCFDQLLKENHKLYH